MEWTKSRYLWFTRINLSFGACVVLFLVPITSTVLGHPPIKPSPDPGPAWNLGGILGQGYDIDVEIGTPPQKFKVLVDTGSSNLAIAAAAHDYIESFFIVDNSTTFVNRKKKVKVIYAQGQWSGYLGQDIVSFPTIKGTKPILTDLSLITESENFYINNSHWQGILGLSYAALAQPHGKVVPWFDRLTKERGINNSLTLQLCGTEAQSSNLNHTGSLFVGEFAGDCNLDPKFTSPIHHAWFYEVLIVKMFVGQNQVEIPCNEFNTKKTILDSGTSDLRLPEKVLGAVLDLMRSQTQDLDLPQTPQSWIGGDIICWYKDSEAWHVFPNITLHFAHNNSTGFSITLTPHSYLRPVMKANPSNDSFECWQMGLDKSEEETVLGAVVLEGLCVQLDRKRGLVGFSPSTCGPTVDIQGLFNVSDIKKCAYVPSSVNPLMLTAYIMASISLVLLLPIMFVVVRRMWETFLKPRVQPETPFISLDENNT
ncbi:beta-secretase 1-like [Oratosquilla oratoria]|uniref:beta-secretase 1-like n=1 Tax=Oratosquilla oratoria TaxID=337810 RepID=UPI003F77488E